MLSAVSAEFGEFCPDQVKHSALVSSRIFDESVVPSACRCSLTIRSATITMPASNCARNLPPITALPVHEGRGERVFEPCILT